jgi:hypothetical protein
MFALNIRSIFGDTIDCRINGKPKRVTWRDEHTLVIEPDLCDRSSRHGQVRARWTLRSAASQLVADCTQEEFARSIHIGGCRPTGAAERSRRQSTSSKDRRAPGARTSGLRLVHRGVDTRDLKEAKALSMS